MDVLEISELRKLAAAEGYQENGYTKVYDVVLFSKHDEQQSTQYTAAGRRFSFFLEAYVKAGDVAVILPHPRQKAWRLFHFGALTSPDLFTTVLQSPFSDSNFSYLFSDIKLTSPPPPSPMLTALERQMTLIDREIGDLQRERTELYKKWKHLSDDVALGCGAAEELEAGASAVSGSRNGYRVTALEARNENGGSRNQNVAAAEEARMTSVASDVLISRANGDRTRGNKAVWSLFYPDSQESFARAWSARSVNSVALGRGFVISYDDGSATWSDISSLLESKLRQQGVTSPNNILKPSGSGGGGGGGGGGSAAAAAGGGTASGFGAPGLGSALSVRIRYLVLGDEGNFYVKFDNGRMEWCGQDSFGAALRRGVSERHLLVEKVAFAQEGGWLIIWSDRTFEGENIPETLEQRLGGTRIEEGRIIGAANGIKDVTLGPAGEWFIIYKDHSVQADNLPDGLYKSLSQIRERSGRVRTIVFGENRSWFVRYWDGGK